MPAFANRYLDMQDYVMRNYREVAETMFYSAAAFFVPFILGHSQLVTGVIVNIALVLAALNLRNEKLLPVILLPSLGALSRGLIFGPFTMFLVYMVPFIWVGNFILVYSVKRIALAYKSKGKSQLRSALTVGVGSTAKAAFIFAAAFILYNLSVIPQALLVPMGILQLVTAAIGASLAMGAQAFKRKYLA